MTYTKLKSEYDLKSYYYIDRQGQVYWLNSKKEYQPVKHFVNKDDYHEYVLTLKNGKKKHVLAHRLVAMTFLKKPTNKKKTQVNHKDGNRSNNIPPNLEWVTPSENIKHSFKKLGKKVWNSNKK